MARRHDHAHTTLAENALDSVLARQHMPRPNRRTHVAQYTASLAMMRVMRRLLVGILVFGWLGACNQVFGIPDVSPAHYSCAQRLVKCAAEATCTDLASGSLCTCNQGYTGDGMTCADIDECAASTSPCAAHAKCTNATGSFSCACDTGYTGDGTSYCVPTVFKKIAPADGFSCGLGDDEGVYCWGRNGVGTMGDGTPLPHARPLPVGTATDWIDVDARSLSACGIRADHSMWCWGLGNSGQLGDGLRMTEYNPTKVISDKPGVGWRALALGRQTHCGIHDDGSLACWGIDRVVNTTVPVPIAVGIDIDWTDVAVGTVLCGLRGAPGKLLCWGNSAAGDLGLGTITSQATPAQVGTDTWKSIKVGDFNACGIRSDGALLCWGNNIETNTSLKYGDTPQQVGTATDWQTIALSSASILGMRAGGNVYGWGVNDTAQLGLPLGPEIDQPTPISGTVTGWSQIRPGNGHSCGIASGQAYCWGKLGDGALGDGAATTLYAPTRIGSDRWTSLTGGPGVCGLRTDGALMCWSYTSGVGNGFGNTDPLWTPTRIGTDTWSALASSTSFGVAATCALRGGQPYCWGDNSFGELGLGNINTPQLTPAAVNVPAGMQWTEIAIGTHTCAIASDATLWCWGTNDAGQLGTGMTSTVPTTAPATPLAGAWLHVAVSGSSGVMSCGIQADHTLWCWGRDQYPETTQHLVPTRVGADASWALLSMDATSNNTNLGVTTCAIRMNGTLWCWGMWLGNGTTNTSAVPVQVGSATDWKAVSVGNEICAIKFGGTLWCWGNGFVLGDGKPPSTYDPFGNVLGVGNPTQIGSDADWNKVMTGGTNGSESCATKTDGSLWCWGLGAAQIPGIATTPVPIH